MEKTNQELASEADEFRFIAQTPKREPRAMSKEEHFHLVAGFVGPMIAIKEKV